MWFRLNNNNYIDNYNIDNNNNYNIDNNNNIINDNNKINNNKYYSIIFYNLINNNV